MASKTTRFRIFERDCFTCQYCGQKPPEVILEADHIVSKKDGGRDDDINLITACFACNRGKGAKSLSIEKIKNKSFDKELSLLKEKKEQLTAYYEFLTKKDKLEDSEMDIYQRCWQEASGGKQNLTDTGLKNVKSLSRRYPAEDIFKAMKITWSKDWADDAKDHFKYMCGILKNMKLERENPEEHERRKKAYSVRFTVLNHCYQYINEKVFWRWVNDGIDLDIVAEKAIELKKWSLLSDYISSEFYE